MGLLTTATADNRIIDKGLSITYSRNLVYGKWHWWNALNVEGDILKCWEYKRFAKKTYRYVGMSFEAAQLKAQEIKDSYTRTFYISQTVQSSSPQFQRIVGGTRCQTDVVVEKQEGHIYQIIVNVNEEDTALSTQISSPESVFSYESSRTYDY